MTAKKSNSDKYNNNREGERETNERKRTRSDRKGGAKRKGRARQGSCAVWRKGHGWVRIFTVGGGGDGVGCSLFVG